MNTSGQRVITAATCPTTGGHLAIISHGAATCSLRLGDRFEFAIGPREDVNEHIVGDSLSSADERLAMLIEAVGVIRMLWTGEWVTRPGASFAVEGTGPCSVPSLPPRIVVLPVLGELGAGARQ